MEEQALRIQIYEPEFKVFGLCETQFTHLETELLINKQDNTCKAVSNILGVQYMVVIVIISNLCKIKIVNNLYLYYRNTGPKN